MSIDLSAAYTITITITVHVPSEKFFSSIRTYLAEVIIEEDLEDSFTLLYEDLFQADEKVGTTTPTVKKFLKAIIDKVTSDGLDVDEIEFVYRE